jgi:hypothetical protein
VLLSPAVKFPHAAAVLLALLLGEAVTAAHAPFAGATTKAILPEAVLQKVPSFHQVGKGSHSYLGLRVYHVALRATGNRWNPDEPHALDLESNRAISRDQLTEAGMSEMTRLGVGNPGQLEAWRKEMERVLPSVKTRRPARGLSRAESQDLLLLQWRRTRGD